jgi:hypothetical protein
MCKTTFILEYELHLWKEFGVNGFIIFILFFVRGFIIVFSRPKLILEKYYRLAKYYCYLLMRQIIAERLR